MSRHGNQNSVFTKGMDKATHVYLKSDNPQGLQPRWHGPYPISKRLGTTTIEVKTGTYANGSSRLECHSWNNAKPAYLADDTVIAQRPKLGRPPKASLPQPDQSHPSLEKPCRSFDHQTSSEQTARLVESEAAKTLNENKQKPAPKPPAPSTHRMNLRERKTK